MEKIVYRNKLHGNLNSGLVGLHEFVTVHYSSPLPTTAIAPSSTLTVEMTLSICACHLKAELKALQCNSVWSQRQRKPLDREFSNFLFKKKNTFKLNLCWDQNKMYSKNISK
jgi:hypothetical protein